MRLTPKFTYLINSSINKLCFIIAFVSAASVMSVRAQGNELMKLSDYEDTLKVLGKLVLHGKHDFIKLDANEKMLSLFEEALKVNKSFSYRFDSLTSVSRLDAPDNSFRIFTWMLAKEDGSFEYFGFIHAKDGKKKGFKIHRLYDRSEEMETPELKTLDNTNWYGALYYKIIYNKYNDKKTYTLLGWDGNNRTSSKKVIEVLTFGARGKPVFGYNLFKSYKKNIKRVIFEYSSTASMSLRFEKQYLDNVVKTNKKRKESKRKVIRSELRKEKINMIVFDRLAPMDPRTGIEMPSLEGKYQFYVPETNIFDAFLFQKGKWVFLKDVDARNPKKKMPKMPDRKRALPLYSPN